MNAPHLNAVTNRLTAAGGDLSLTTNRQCAAAWNYTVGAITGTPPENWPAILIRAAEFALGHYPAAPDMPAETSDVEDTDAVCVHCRHSVEDCAHYLGCDQCACPASVLPGD